VNTLLNLHLLKNRSILIRGLARTFLHQMILISKICWDILLRNKMKLLIPISIWPNKRTRVHLTHNSYSMTTIRRMLPKAKGKHSDLKSLPRMNQWCQDILVNYIIQLDQTRVKVHINLKFNLLFINQDLVTSKDFLQQSNWTPHPI